MCGCIKKMRTVYTKGQKKVTVKPGRPVVTDKKGYTAMPIQHEKAKINSITKTITAKREATFVCPKCGSNVKKMTVNGNQSMFKCLNIDCKYQKISK